ncbi:MAG: PepSY-like domain-containing protein [Candidatus Latescibacterota bacterium]|nr:MAG: PepSY-like domain-containing protein [Candidatus Latescibacterota bacterium]
MRRDQAPNLVLASLLALSLVSCQAAERAPEASEAAVSHETPAPEAQIPPPERDVTEAEVPQAVLAAFNQAYPGAHVKGYSEEVSEGNLYYEVSFEFQGRQLDVIFDPDGITNTIEEQIPVDALPEKMRQTIEQEFAEFSYERAETVQKGSERYFEALVVDAKNGMMHEMVFSPGGDLIERQAKKPGEID